MPQFVKPLVLFFLPPSLTLNVFGRDIVSLQTPLTIFCRGCWGSCGACCITSSGRYHGRLRCRWRCARAHEGQAVRDEDIGAESCAAVTCADQAMRRKTRARQSGVCRRRRAERPAEGGQHGPSRAEGEEKEKEELTKLHSHAWNLEVGRASPEPIPRRRRALQSGARETGARVWENLNTINYILPYQRRNNKQHYQLPLLTPNSFTAHTQPALRSRSARTAGMSLSIPNAPNQGLFKPGYQKYALPLP